MPNPTLIALTFINVLNYLDRYLVAALLPLISASLTLSHTQEGILVAAFVVGYTAFSPLFGYWGDRKNRVVLMAIGVALWSLATSLGGFATTFGALFLARAFVGIGEASFGTIAPGYIRDRLSTPGALNNSLALFFCAIPVGSALGYVCGGIIAAHSSWNTAFMVCGIPGIIMALVLLRFREPPRTEAHAAHFISGAKEIFKSSMLRYAIGGYILNSFALNGIAAFVSGYGQTLGFTNAQITSAFGIILVVTGSIGTYGGGRLASALTQKSDDPLKGLLKFNGWCSLLAVPFIAIAFLISHQFGFLAFCFIAELLVFAATAPVNSVIVQSAPAGTVTLTQGVTILALNLLGSLPAPIFMGFVADHTSLKGAMQIPTVALALSGLVWLMGGRGATLKSRAIVE